MSLEESHNEHFKQTEISGKKFSAALKAGTHVL